MRICDGRDYLWKHAGKISSWSEWFTSWPKRCIAQCGIHSGRYRTESIQDNRSSHLVWTWQSDSCACNSSCLLFLALCKTKVYSGSFYSDPPLGFFKFCDYGRRARHYGQTLLFCIKSWVNFLAFRLKKLQWSLHMSLSNDRLTLSSCTIASVAYAESAAVHNSN